MSGGPGLVDTSGLTREGERANQMRWHRARATRRRGQRGAASQRLLLALGASALLTAAVSLPMAYQAYEARQQDEPGQATQPDPEVLGTTTVRPSAARSDTIYWQLEPSGPELLHESDVPDGPRIFLDLDDVVRADFRLDDGPVMTDTTEPFELDDGAPVQLDPGPHSVTVTVTDAEGVSTLHQAFFTGTG